MNQVKLKTRHSGGLRKIYDRKPALNDKQEPIEGKWTEVVHTLSTAAFEVKTEPMLDENGKEIIDTQFDPPKKKMKKVTVGKPFEVHDLEYVMKRHGAILEKA